MAFARAGNELSRPPRVGVVAHQLGADPYERDVVGGIIAAVKARGGSVLCFAIKGVESDFDAFVGPGHVDAIVVLSGPIIHAVGRPALEAFCEKRSEFPIASIGSPLSRGVATVRADGAAGVRKALAHLVDVHGRRRIGFVRGPATLAAVNERFEGYIQALADNGISFHPEWIASTQDLDDGGDEAIRVLFDERKLGLQAVVTFNDAAALAVLAALVRREIRVPEDVAIVGYHDIPEADHVVPPLTTVTQKLYEQGWRAANLVLSALEGKELPEEIVLDTELIVRRSCGCFSRSVLGARASGGLDPFPVEKRAWDEGRADVVLAMNQVQGLDEGPFIERWLAAFDSDLAHPKAHRFLSTLDERLNRAAQSGGDLGCWDEVLSVMRRAALPLFAHNPAERGLAEDIWHEARVLVGDTAQRAQAYQRILDGERTRTLGSISRSLIAAKDIDELRDVLRKGLPQLGVKSCHVSLYEDGKSGRWSKLALGIDEQGQDSHQVGSRFATSDLMPGGILRRDGGSVTVVVPLSFEGEQRGTIVLETDPSQSTASYGELREQFGAAFKRIGGEHELALLHETQRERVEELELAHQALRENQEKLLISERMASLGRLTAGMAHEMNTPLAAVRAALGEMLELIDEYRASIDAPEVTSEDHREIAAEMVLAAKLADNAAQRVAGFVRGIKIETRDLSPKEYCHFDPVPVIEETLLLLSHAARAANCTVSFTPETRVMDLFGSPSRLSQVVTNLVTNAIDASAEKGGGPVELVLGSWHRGLELLVIDRGAGIAPENLGKIFYPMYTSKPFGVGTGLGLTIVRDIVTGDFNGTVDVKSELGVGTTFVLRFTRA